MSAFLVQRLHKSEYARCKSQVPFLQRFAQLRDRFIVAARIIIIAARVRVVAAKRIELDGSLFPRRSGRRTGLSAVSVLLPSCLVRNHVISVQLQITHENSLAERNRSGEGQIPARRCVASGRRISCSSRALSAPAAFR